MGKAQKPRAEIMQMIERVRDGEDAEDVVTGLESDKGGKDVSGDLDECLERFLTGRKRKR